MPNIRIITDSASDLCTDIPANVTVIPIAIRFGDQEFLDGVTISHHRFYEKLIESDALPTTSLISPATFAEAYEAAVAAGETVIAITVSGKLSGTYQSAAIAAQEYPGKVFVVDSMNAALGQQNLVRYAAQLAQETQDVQQVVSALEEAKGKIHTMAVLDTLEYLKKGGRISNTVAFVGGMLAIKPVVAVVDGAVAMLGKARGSKNGNNFLIKEVTQAGGIDFEKPVCLGYTGLSDDMLQKYLQDSKPLYEGQEDRLRICTVGATIGTHIGPGAVVVSFFAK